MSFEKSIVVDLQVQRYLHSQYSRPFSSLLSYLLDLLSYFDLRPPVRFLACYCDTQKTEITESFSAKTSSTDLISHSPLQLLTSLDPAYRQIIFHPNEHSRRTSRPSFIMSKTEGQGLDLPNYGPTDYAKFFGAGALAATLTHGVRLDLISTPGPYPQPPPPPKTEIPLELSG